MSAFIGRDGLGSPQQIAAQGDGSANPFAFQHTRTPATSTPLAGVVAPVQAVAAAVGLKLIGFTVLETAGGAAALSLFHGVSTGGVLLDVPAVLTANQRLQVSIPGGGVACPNGIWLQRTSGTFTIVFYTEQG